MSSVVYLPVDYPYIDEDNPIYDRERSIMFMTASRSFDGWVAVADLPPFMMEGNMHAWLESRSFKFMIQAAHGYDSYDIEHTEVPHSYTWVDYFIRFDDPGARRWFNLRWKPF
jgi:hypothetical protein